VLKDVLKDSNLDGQIKAIFPGTKQTVRKTKQIFDVEVAGLAAKVRFQARTHNQALPRIFPTRVRLAL